VADPSGHVIYRASESKEQIVLADCDLSKVEKTRREWPFLRDRRIDAYQNITSRILTKK
jgi:N-carbamoylputrescine amidase